jgi:MFS family permease/quinol monooxygenase YgiN
MSVDPPPQSAGPWSPLKLGLFRLLWLATLVSNIGTWMHDVGAAWLMTSLAPTPLMVALVQTATTLPIFLLALPAGALSDIIDRRRYLIVLQCWLAGVAALLAILTLSGLTSAWILVLLTFALGIGTALMMPAWASLTPELVPRELLQPAIALNSMSINIARAIGPAIAGIIVAQTGPAVVFALNAVSFLGIIAVLLYWRRTPAVNPLPAERFCAALRTGIRFARHAPALQAALIKGFGFFLFASASWALLPLLARQEVVGGGPQTYGILMASVGVGAVAGAIALPRLRERLSSDQLIFGASLLYAITLLALASFKQWLPLAGVMILSGMAWIAILSSLQVAAQLAVPNWVRSRGLAVFMAVFMGGMAGGSLLWGHLAELTAIPIALMTAAVGLAITSMLTWPWRLSAIEQLDWTPSMHWPTPVTAFEPENDRGPVMVTTEYRIEPQDREAFNRAMREMRQIRRRNGAVAWGLFVDAADPMRYIEYFVDESWVEHLRQHQRVSVADRAVQESVRRFQVGAESPVVTHFLAETLPKDSAPSTLQT